MDKTRMEAFSDAVIAIIITIMVLEMKIPHGEEWSALKPIIPVFLSYVMSFAYLAIYWNNHHHLLKAVKSVDGRVLWANMVLLFWMSLIPFVTGWMGENHFARNPVILYGVNLLLAGLSYNILVKVLLHSHGKDSLLAKALGNDIKGKFSMVIYAAAICLAFVSPILAGCLYALVAVMWIVPDERIEKVLRS
ncbi:MAG: DUF1211 domain-containing protein [Candidatus Omnitrophica bacterium]|nr:DUF1211 domain-containing protein [Candidatus Omnitrophota bacterium]MCB9721889.1 DUF1211 domain-containing protein [Candidatus Omnitrophota bacterium]